MIDVSGLRVLDVHGHPFLNRGEVTPSEFTDATNFGDVHAQYITEAGMEFTPEIEAELQRNMRNTIYHKRMVLDLATYLDVEPTLEAVIEARNAAVKKDYTEYVRGMWADAGLDSIVFDMGYPLPPVPMEPLKAQLPIEIVPIYRIEPLIKDLLNTDIGWAEFSRVYEDTLVEALTNGGYRGLKSVIAYRTGLDVSPLSRTKDQGYYALDAIRRGLGGGSMKKLRDHLFCRAIEIAMELDVPMQVHTGMGDFEVNLPLCRPAYLMDLLRFPAYRTCHVLLVHGGYPYSQEAGYLASVLPRVYMDLSEGIPFAGYGAMGIVAHALEMVPLTKICYGSDGYKFAEVYYTSAKLGKQAVARGLDTLVSEGMLGAADAQTAAGWILSENSRRLYHLDS